MRASGVFLFLCVIALSCTQKVETKLASTQVEPLPDSIPATPTLLYGFPIDSFDVFKGKVKWNQTLSSIVENFGITNEQIYQIANLSKDVFDVRKLKAGQPYTIIHGVDESRIARQFIFEPDQRSFVVFNFADSLFVDLVRKEVKVVEKSVAAEINSTLNSVDQAIRYAGGSSQLVHKIVDILAWQVDFQHIQPGDHFKIIYEEEQVDGESVGIKNIEGVYFRHVDEDYYGIRYQNKDGKEDYFDENGNSLRRTFLKAPVSYKRISSRYSGRRFHPVLKRYKAHRGTDYAANPGTPIRTTGDGIVTEAKYHKYNGNYVKIRHNSNFSTQYLHMQKIKSGIRPGVKVKQGQTIGFVGSTGLARGPHVCYRFWKNGKQVDALNVDLPPSEPIDASKLNPYLHQKNVMLHKLSLIDFPESPRLLANVGGQP